MSRRKDCTAIVIAFVVLLVSVIGPPFACQLAALALRREGTR